MGFLFVCFFFKAPELLKSGKYEKPVDVYSFGLLVYQMVTGLIPYSDIGVQKGWELTQRILDGLRPTIPKDIAKKKEYDDIISLAKKCWVEDPLARPGKHAFFFF